MQEADKKAFADLIAGLFAYHRQAVSPAIITVYWRGCQEFTLEQVTKAIDALTKDPDPKVGDFVPKLSGIVRMLQGTQTDRSLIAWGKVSGAMGYVGAWRDVAFDDPIIHLCINDVGGWPKVARTPYEDQSYLQHAFCKAYQAYANRGAPTEWPSFLVGASEGKDEYAKVGMTPPRIKLVGDVDIARRVVDGGTAVVRLTAKPAVAALPAALVGEPA